MSSNKTKKNNVTDQQVDEVIEEMKSDLLANPNPEAVHELRQNYGVTFDITGELVEVREPKRLRKKIRKELEESQEQSGPRAREIAQKFTRGASKTGELIAYYTVDAPVEGAKTTTQVVKGAARDFKSKAKAAHERRLDNAAKRRKEREERKAAREQVKAEQASEEKALHEARVVELEKNS